MPTTASPELGLDRLIIDWFDSAARPLPWRHHDVSAWGILVSEFMLQQTPVARVIPRWDEWMARWPTPSALAAVAPGEAVRAWDRLGYPRRALALHQCAVLVSEQFNDVVPNDVQTLLGFPGIGDYTARAIVCFAYQSRVPVVDTNTRRVIARALEGSQTAGVPNAKRDLAMMTPLLPRDQADAAAFNAGMMELGAIVCTARSPRCDQCPLSALCTWRSLDYPQTSEPKKPVQKKYEGSERQERGRILALLRDANQPLALETLQDLAPSQPRFESALASLQRDKLVQRHGTLVRLP